MISDVVQYVDDCGISAPTQDRIDQFIEGLKQHNLDLTLEGSFEEFLGIKFKYNDDGSIECTQRGLIQRMEEIVTSGTYVVNDSVSTHVLYEHDMKLYEMMEI